MREAPSTSETLDFSYNNPQLAKYQALAARLRRHPVEYLDYPRESRATSPLFTVIEGTGRYFADFREKSKKLLKGGVLLDLGGGSGEVGYLAEELGAKSYINIEKHAKSSVTTQSGCRKETIAADMLVQLAQIQTGSLSLITINGIDSYVIESDEYHRALMAECERVLRPGGLVFGANSDLFIFSNPKAFKKLGPGNQMFEVFFAFERV